MANIRLNSNQIKFKEENIIVIQGTTRYRKQEKTLEKICNFVKI